MRQKHQFCESLPGLHKMMYFTFPQKNLHALHFLLLEIAACGERAQAMIPE
jgi:hypothetical protein